MNKPVVLAFAGGLHASAAIPWLIDTMGVEVVTVTLDVGQGHELGELRARALDCGASRAHVVDARDDFARDVLFPSLRTAAADEARNAITALAWPLIARKLVEIARIEHASAVAHGSTDPAFDAAIRAIDSSIDIVAPARKWTMGADDLASYARARRLPVTATSATDCQIDQNLWGRIVAWTSHEAPNPITALAWPLIARKLVEIARIENASAVAHGSTEPAFDAAIRAIDSSIDIIAPARNWTMGADDLASYARARRLPVTATSSTDCQIDQNLWGRIVAWTSQEAPAAIKTRSSRRLDEPATLDLHFEHGAPTSVNGVPMSPAELIECVALIGGQYGIGQTVVSAQGRQVLYDAPAATVLQIAASVAGQKATADVCLKLADGAYTVLSPSDRHALLVNA